MHKTLLFFINITFQTSCIYHIPASVQWDLLIQSDLPICQVKNNVIALSFLIPYTLLLRCKVSGGYEKIFILTLSSLKTLNNKYKQPFLPFHYIIFYFTLSLYKSTGFNIFLNFFINFIKILYNYKKLDLFFKITWYFNKFL